MTALPDTQDNARSLHNSERKYPWTHQVIKNYVLEVIQLLFYPGNPIGYCWDINQEKTEITVVDKYSFNLDQVGMKPAIVVNRGPLNWMSTSGFRQVQHIDLRKDARTYTDRVRGGAMVSCFSRQGLESEDLAGYLYDSFQALRDVLRKMARKGIMVPNHLGFFRIQATSMGEEALVKSDSRPEVSVVPVAISAIVQRRWRVTPDARKLEDITVRTNRSGT